MYLDLAADGIILHDENDFAKGILGKIRKRISDVGLARYRAPSGHLGWRLDRPLAKGEKIVIELEG